MKSSRRVSGEMRHTDTQIRSDRTSMATNINMNTSNTTKQFLSSFPLHSRSFQELNTMLLVLEFHTQDSVILLPCYRVRCFSSFFTSTEVSFDAFFKGGMSGAGPTITGSGIIGTVGLDLNRTIGSYA